MRFNQIPKKTDRGLVFSAYESIVRQNQKLNNIQFDPNAFQVLDDPSGLYVTLNNQAVSSGDDFEHHLQGIVTNSNTASANGASVVVHGAVWKRYAAGEVKKIDLTVDGGGTSEEYAEFKTVDNIISSGYIIGELDDPLTPTTFTIRKIDDYPQDDAILNDITNSCSTVVLGYCNVNSTSNVLTFEQYWTGGDLQDVAIIPDGNRDSANTGINTLENRPSDGALQIFDSTNSASRTRTLILAYENAPVRPIHTQWVPTDTSPISCGIDPSAAYPAGEEGQLNTRGLARSDHYHHISDSDHATNADHADTADWADTTGECITISGTHPHANHTFGTDDHHIGPDNYLNISSSGIATRNTTSEDCVVGDNNGVGCLNFAHRQLLSRNDGTTPIICWDTEGGGPWCANWNADNRWNSAEFSFSVTDACTWIITDTLSVTTENLTWEPGTDDTNDFKIGDTKAWKEISLYANTLSLSATTIVYGGAPGVDIADWTTKGGLTGATVTELTDAYFLDSVGNVIGPYDILVR